MLLFVYGTLKRRFEAHEILAGSRFVSEGSISGSLYDLGVDFPAAVNDGTRNRVFGELFEIQDGLIDDIDEYEGFNPDDPDESVFVREIADISLPDRKTVKAEVYYMPENQLSRFFAHPIQDGKWK